MSKHQDRVYLASMSSRALHHLADGKTVPVAPQDFGPQGSSDYDRDVFIVDGYVDEDYLFCQELADNEDVDRALRELVEDATADNGVRVVEAVIRALKNYGTD